MKTKLVKIKINTKNLSITKKKDGLLFSFFLDWGYLFMSFKKMIESISRKMFEKTHKGLYQGDEQDSVGIKTLIELKRIRHLTGVHHEAVSLGGLDGENALAPSSLNPVESTPKEVLEDLDEIQRQVQGLGNSFNSLEQQIRELGRSLVIGDDDRPVLLEVLLRVNKILKTIIPSDMGATDEKSAVESDETNGAERRLMRE